MDGPEGPIFLQRKFRGGGNFRVSTSRASGRWARVNGVEMKGGDGGESATVRACKTRY